MTIDLYCCTCGTLAKCVVDETMHLVPARAFAICEGPFAFCPPPDEGAFSIPDDTDFEQEEDETDNPYTFDDVRFDPISQYPN